MSGRNEPKKKSELELLRAALGRGPANLFIHLVLSAWSTGEHKRGWRIGPAPACRIYGWPDDLRCSPESFRRWRSKLIDAGLLRVTMPAVENRGYVYEILGVESFPVMECLWEYIDELCEEERAQEARRIEGRSRRPGMRRDPEGHREILRTVRKENEAMSG